MLLIKNTDYAMVVLPDGTCALFGSEGQVVTLSPTAGLLWEFCDGAHSVEALADEIHQVYPNQPVNVISAEVEVAVADFCARGLVSARPALTEKEQGDEST